MDLRKDIIQAALQEFKENGIRFTMADIAKRLNISKKTIYTIFENKDALFLSTVDYCFDAIKESERRVLEDSSLSTIEKIRRILGVMPDSYKDMDFQKLYTLKDKHPAIYKKVEERLENGWETTIALLEQGMEEGCVREIPIPVIKTMLEATLEQFFRRDVLLANGIPYGKALNTVVNILVDGIRTRPEE